MTDREKRLSIQLDEAREREAHHRALLLFWKQRRQRLEAQIPTDDPFTGFLSELFNDDNSRTLPFSLTD